MSTKDGNPKDSIGDKKIPLWLCSPVAKANWALAQFAGMVKYGAWNWRVAGARTSVYLSAMQRHIDAYASGEQTDPVDGTHHLGNVMACCAILIEAEALKNVIDDRAPQLEFRGIYAQIEEQMKVLREQYKELKPKHFSELNK